MERPMKPPAAAMFPKPRPDLAGCRRPALLHAGWFVESLFTQTLSIHVLRVNKNPFIDSWASWPLIFTTGRPNMTSPDVQPKRFACHNRSAAEALAQWLPLRKDSPRARRNSGWRPTG